MSAAFKYFQFTVTSQPKKMMMMEFPDESDTRSKTRYRISGRFFKHFSNNSSIPGLKLITQDGVSWFERLVFYLDISYTPDVDSIYQTTRILLHK